MDYLWAIANCTKDYYTYMELFWQLNIHMCQHWSGWARRDQT